MVIFSILESFQQFPEDWKAVNGMSVFKKTVAGSLDITSVSELFGSKTKCWIVSIGLNFKVKLFQIQINLWKTNLVKLK